MSSSSNTKRSKEVKKFGKQYVASKHALLKLTPSCSADSIEQALNWLKEVKYAKFDETVEATFRLGIDPKRSDQTVRGVADMPAGTGKKVRVAVLCESNLIQEAIAAGADFYDSTAIIADIEKSKINFDVLIATPGFVGQIAKFAKILGPKGLMPNPKLGTVTKDIGAAVTKTKAGQVEYRSDKGANVMAGIGKLSFDSKKLIQNFQSLLDAIIRSKPAESKGVYMKKIYLSTTNGHSIRLILNV